MSFNATQRSFLLFILGVGALVAIVFCLAFYFPVVGEYAYLAVLGVAGVFVLYVSFMPLFSFLSERADIILRVYLDETGEGIHIFSAYSVSRYKIFRPPVRYIQHYFIVTATGKRYYKVLFSHQQQPIAGESGYTGYSSFETGVLESEAFRQSMETFSAKTKMNLHLGKPVSPGENDLYTIQNGDRVIEIKKFTTTFDDVFKVLCYDTDMKTLLWKRKI